MQAAVPGRQTHPSLPIHTKRRSNPHLLISLHEPSTQIAWHEKKICPHAPQLTHPPPPPQQQANVRPYTDRGEEKMARGRTCGERRAHPPHSGPVCLAACGGGPRPTLLCDGARRRRAERKKAVQREDGERTRAAAGWPRRGRRVNIPHPPLHPLPSGKKNEPGPVGQVMQCHLFPAPAAPPLPGLALLLTSITCAGWD